MYFMRKQVEQRKQVRHEFATYICCALVVLVASLPTVSAQPNYVEAWGYNFFGQTDVPAGLTNVVAVAAGTVHTLALRSDGTVVAWGNQSVVPAGLSNVVAISTGNNQSMALKNDGSVVVWGDTESSVTNVPPGVTNIVAIDAGWNGNGARFNLALKGDGTIAVWGNEPGVATVPPGLDQVAAIAAGTYHCLALKSNGTVVAWGNPSSVPAGLSNVTAIAAGQNYSLALKSDGTIAAWGQNPYGETEVPVGLINVIGIAAGTTHAAALKNDGTLVAWGYNGNGATNVPTGLTNVSAITAGDHFNVALTTTPLIRITSPPQSLNTNAGATATFSVTVACQVPVTYQWQKNRNNLSGATNATLVLPNVQISDAGDYSVAVSHPGASLTSSTATLAVVPRPTIVVSPRDTTNYAGGNAWFTATVTSSLPVTYQWLKNGTNLINVDSSTLVLGSWQEGNAGSYQLIATSSAGSVTSAPANLTIMSTRPVGTVVRMDGAAVPAGLTNIVAIAAGTGINPHSVALRSNGTVVAWGGDFQGKDAAVPPGLSNVVAIAAGESFSIALKEDGTAASWGEFPIGLGTQSNVVAIAAKTRNLVALKSDGTLVSGPAGLSNVVSIAAGGYSSAAAIRSDGTLVVWGSIGTPDALNGLAKVVAVDLVGDLGSQYGLALRADDTVTMGGRVGPYGPDLTNLPGFSNIVAVSLGNNHGLALKQDSTVLGYGVTPPQGLTNVIAVSAGYNYTLLLVSGGPVITTHPASLTANAGENAYLTVVAVGAPLITYQWQKDGTNIAGATNVTLSLTNVLPVDAGSYTVIAANGAGSSISVPATFSVTTSPGITVGPHPETVFTGSLVTFSAGAAGAVPRTYQWLHDGNFINGATNLSLTLPITLAGDAGSYAVVISNSYGMITSAPAILTLTAHVFTMATPGTVVGIGTTVPSGLTNIVAVAAGTGFKTHSVALRGNGTVVAWGGDFFGKDATVPAGLSNVVAIAAGESFSIALKSDGTVTSWGEFPVWTAPADFGLVAVAAKGRTALALKSDGTVVQMGGYGSTPVGLSNVVAIAAGGYSSAAIMSDGTLVVWGIIGMPDALNGLTNVVAVDLKGSIGDAFGLALRADSTVTRGSRVSFLDTGLTNLPGFSNVVAVSVGNDHGLALKNDTTVLGFGVTLPDGLTNVSAISAGAGYSLLITTNPPLPMLSASGQSSSNISLSTPVFVSGYVLEAADDPMGTYTVIETFTNAPALGPTLDIPKDGSKKYFRLRKL